MSTIESSLRDAIVDATVTDAKTGEEIDDVSACYLALAQDVQGTLPDHITVSWGPSATRRRQDVSQAPGWVWEAALAGHLVLTDGAVAIADGHEHRYA